MSTGQQIVESIVFTNLNLNLNPEGVDREALSDALESLNSLGLAIHISAGLAMDLNNIHVLHCRFNTHSDLKAFFNHPEYKSVVTKFLPLNKYGDATTAADWISNTPISDFPKPGSAMKIMLMNWKEGVDVSGKFKFLQAIGGLKDQSKEIEYITYGEDSEPHDPIEKHDYLVCSIIYFRGVEELEAFNEDEELQKSLQEKMKDSVETSEGDSQFVADYVLRLPK